MVVDRPRVNVHAAEPQRDDLNTAAQASTAPCEAVEDHPGGECLCAACVPHSGESATRSPKPSGRSGRRLRRAMSAASFDSCRTSLQRSRHADRLRAPALSGARRGGSLGAHRRAQPVRVSARSGSGFGAPPEPTVREARGHRAFSVPVGRASRWLSATPRAKARMPDRCFQRVGPATGWKQGA
jgi:hypothetical protein